MAVVMAHAVIWTGGWGKVDIADLAEGIGKVGITALAEG